MTGFVRRSRNRHADHRRSDPDRERLLPAAVVGGVAALVASAAMLWCNQRWGGVLPSQALSDRALTALPLDVLRRALVMTGSDAKPLAFISTVLAQVAVGAILAMIFSPFARVGARQRIAGALALVTFASVTWLAVAAPIGGMGWFAIDAAGGVWRTQLTVVTGAVIFGALTALLLPWPKPRALSGACSDGRSFDRRQFATALLAAVSTGSGLISIGYLGRHAAKLRRGPPGSITRRTDTDDAFQFEGMPSVVTATDEFYVVSKNFVDPAVDATTWRLLIEGRVERPREWSYSDILAHDSSDFVSTLICISNTVGGPYASTAQWRGFPLRELLLEAGVRPGAVDLELRAADGYVESLPIEKAMAPDTMIVHSMNGAPLGDIHGYPLRLIVPGRYGIKNVKWITGMTVVDEDVRGYWQQRLWSDTAIIETTSRIDTPRRGRRIPLGELVRIGGMAFGADRGISRVELSLDNGATWFDVPMMDELSRLAWRLWTFEYTPAATGIVKIAVRATDGTGTIQSSIDREPLPEGATGYHHIWFEVRESGT